jgi:hypothetical protein
MQDLKFDFGEVSIVAPEWEECWESILSLPFKPLDNRRLFEEAVRQVQTCHSRAGDEGIGWFEWQVRDGQLFVAEQLASDPNDLEWQRIDAVLAGARSGTTEVKKWRP